MKNLPTRYQNALDYIYSFVDYSRTHQDQLSPENFDLSRMWDFMERLGHPQDDYRSIHIAGSKGKGSVSAFCASVLREAGFRVGLYTSPHLKDFEERIQINGIPIPRERLVELVEELKPHIAAVPRLTTFEIMTALGFVHFSRQEVDIAVVEVGLGGRLDATNVITPEVSVITSLYLEHTGILGDTLAEIAGEKGGIIKPGVPVVVAPQKEEALRVIREIARKQSAPLVQVGVDFTYTPQTSTLDGQTFSITRASKGKDQLPVEIKIPLLGPFQVDNAAVAYAVLLTAREEGILFPESAISPGMRKTSWPARFEVARRSPPVVFDSAHNPSAVEKLMEAVKQYFPGQRFILVFGISEDKELSGMIQEIAPYTSRVITTRADHPRAMDADLLLARFQDAGVEGEAIPNVSSALRAALDQAADREMVLVSGSIFVAASARIAWHEISGE